MRHHPVSMDESAGMRGLKQIWRSLVARGAEEREEVFEKHSQHFLNRCFRDWSRSSTQHS